jgi:hypothetical protein
VFSVFCTVFINGFTHTKYIFSVELETTDTRATPRQGSKGENAAEAKIANPHFRETAPSRLLRQVEAHHNCAGVYQLRRE